MSDRKHCVNTLHSAMLAPLASEVAQAPVDDPSLYHIDFTKSCATHFNHVLQANILDNSRTYLSLATPMGTTISPDCWTMSVSLRVLGIEPDPPVPGYCSLIEQSVSPRGKS